MCLLENDFMDLIAYLQVLGFVRCGISRMGEVGLALVFLGVGREIIDVQYIFNVVCNMRCFEY